MVLSSNQPYFLPYLGYWQMIYASDVFLICDNFQFIKRGWITRNRILVNGNPYLFSIEVDHQSSNKLISELYLTENIKYRKKLLRTVYLEYHKTPHFDEGYSLFENVLFYQDLNLASYLENSIRMICSYLSINTSIRKTSELVPYGEMSKQDKIIKDCRELGASEYLNLIGGKDLYKANPFNDNGIVLKFIKSDLPRYQQYHNSFIPSLSILDAIMFCSKDELHTMLNKFSIEKAL